jgi:superfamily II DNA or RNA helicase
VIEDEDAPAPDEGETAKAAKERLYVPGAFDSAGLKRDQDAARAQEKNEKTAEELGEELGDELAGGGQAGEGQASPTLAGGGLAGANWPAGLERAELWAHQRRAVDAAVEALTGAGGPGRATVAMACRTGKTLVAAEVARRVLELRAGGPVALFVPSLALVRQAAATFVARGWDALLVGSDLGSAQTGGATGTAGGAAGSEGASAVGGRMTTDPAEVAAWTGGAGPRPRVLVSTYDSAHLVDVARLRLAMFDEAHHECGPRDAAAKFQGPLARCLALGQPGAGGRAPLQLHLTATPDRRPPPPKTPPDAWLTMRDPDSFGGIVFRYSLSEAVRDRLVNRFRMALVACPACEPAAGKPAKGRGMGAVHEAALCEGIEAAAAIAAPMLVYCESIKEAERLCAACAARGALECFVAHSRMPAATRRARLQAFASQMTPWAPPRRGEGGMERGEAAPTPTGAPPRPRVMFNCRLYQEGVEIRPLRSVFFAAPRRSFVDIVQSVCRPLTRCEGKPEESVIFLPVAVRPPGAAADQPLDPSANPSANPSEHPADASAANAAATGGGPAAGRQQNIADPTIGAATDAPAVVPGGSPTGLATGWEAVRNGAYGYENLIVTFDALAQESQEVFEGLLDDGRVPFEVVGARSLGIPAGPAGDAARRAIADGVRLAARRTPHGGLKASILNWAPWPVVLAALRPFFTRVEAGGIGRAPKRSDDGFRPVPGGPVADLSKLFARILREYDIFKAEQTRPLAAPPLSPSAPPLPPLLSQLPPSGRSPGRRSALEPYQVRDLEALPEWAHCHDHAGWEKRLALLARYIARPEVAEFIRRSAAANGGVPCLPPGAFSEAEFIGFSATEWEQLSELWRIINTQDGRGRDRRTGKSHCRIQPWVAARIDAVLGPLGLRWRHERDADGDCIRPEPETCIEFAKGTFHAALAEEGEDARSGARSGARGIPRRFAALYPSFARRAAMAPAVFARRVLDSPPALRDRWAAVADRDAAQRSRSAGGHIVQECPELWETGHLDRLPPLAPGAQRDFDAALERRIAQLEARPKDAPRAPPGRGRRPRRPKQA